MFPIPSKFFILSLPKSSHYLPYISLSIDSENKVIGLITFLLSNMLTLSGEIIHLSSLKLKG